MKVNYRYNTMEITSLRTFAQVKGGYTSQGKDVCFIRMQGAHANLQEELRNVEDVLRADVKHNRIGYQRLDKLAILSNREEIDYYAVCYDTWSRKGKKQAFTKVIGSNGQLSYAFADAIEIVLLRYIEGKKNISESIKKNFVVKLMFWLDCVFMKDGISQLKRWDERSCYKIIAENVEKETEYLFFYMLTLLGMDVLLLQMKKDIELSEDLKNLSQTITIGEYVNWELEKYDELVGNKAVHENSKVSEEGVEKNLEAMTADKEKVVVHIPERKRKSRNIQEKIVVSEELLRQKVDVKRSTERATRERKELSYEQLAQLASSVVMIAIHDETGEVIGTGSGIMIGRGGFILTNFHVIRGGAYFSIRMEDEEKIYRTDEVIKYHSDLDLAILRIDRILTPIPVYEGKEKLVRGQRVVAIGSPLGLFNSVSDGIISGFRTTEKAQMIQFTAPTSPGSSGGALLNLYGEVIGISTAGIDGGQNINLAVPYESILPFIRGFS